MGSIIAELVDTGEKRGGRGRSLNTAERRSELVQAYRQSGLTMVAFARREGVKYPTFAGWVNRSRRTRSGKRPAVRFSEVMLPLPVPPAGLEVRLPDGTVLRGGTADELAALVRALRA
jgi:transposase-like protein